MQESPSLNPSAEIDPVLPIRVAAILAGDVHRCTLQRCVDRGELQFIRISPRRIGVRKSELLRWLDSRAAA